MIFRLTLLHTIIPLQSHDSNCRIHLSGRTGKVINRRRKKRYFNFKLLNGLTVLWYILTKSDCGIISRRQVPTELRRQEPQVTRFRHSADLAPSCLMGLRFPEQWPGPPCLRLVSGAACETWDRRVKERNCAGKQETSSGYTVTPACWCTVVLIHYSHSQSHLRHKQSWTFRWYF